tara:strand:+ start:2346 stop:4067 length:1722 start_codon:yes stop_codon:yes gene_type:complete
MPASKGKTVAGQGSKASQNLREMARQQALETFASVSTPKPIKKLLDERTGAGNIRWRALIGYNSEGKQVKRSFGENQRLALAFQEQWNQALESKDTLALENLGKIAAYDIKWCLEEMAKVNVPLREAVRFYLDHALPESGFLNWEQAIEKYYEIQTQKNLSEASSSKKHKNHRTYFVPLQKHFKTKTLLSTTWKDVKSYLEKRGKNWSEQTYNNHLNIGRRFWNVLAESKYCSTELNPFDQIPRKKRKVKRGAKKIMHPREVRSFFRYVEQEAKKDKTKYQELALMTLTFFCGIRITEVSRCNWRQLNTNFNPQDVDETNWTITVYADQEKTSMDKVNPIPTNAKYWLSLCKKNRIKGRDKIVADNYNARMKKLRGAFVKEMKDKWHWPVSVPQNTARHCFASYHLGRYKNYPLTVTRLKHGNVNTLKQHYEATIHPNNAISFFEIVPEDIYQRQENLKAKELDERWSKYEIYGTNQKYITGLIRAAKGEFIKILSKKGISEVDIDESILNHSPITDGEKVYLFDEQDVIVSFAIEAKRTGFESVENPKLSDLKKEHIKMFNESFFLHEEIVI